MKQDICLSKPGGRFTNVSLIANVDVNVRVALTSVSLRVTICELRSKLIVSLRAVRGTLRMVFMHVVHINTQSNNKI